MDSTNIIIPFDFPFAILEHRNNADPNNKLVYAIADGQYTYGPLSLFQYHNDEKYSKTIRAEQLPPSLPCKEFYIVESDFSIDGAIEITDNNRGRIFVKEINQELQQVQLKELMQEVTECKNELRSLKSIVLSEERATRRSASNIKTSYTPINQRSVSTLVKKNVNTPPRSQSVTTTRILMKTVKSSGHGQQIPAIATPTRSLRK